MSQTNYPDPSVAILVDRLVAYLRTTQRGGPFAASFAVPRELTDIFPAFGDHLVVLMALATSDEKVVAAEREVVLKHCLELAARAGVEIGNEQAAALEDFIREFRPTPMQLVGALRNLKGETKNEVERLVAAARAVIEADGVVRLREALDFDSLERELARLTAN